MLQWLKLARLRNAAWRKWLAEGWRQ